MHAQEQVQVEQAVRVVFRTAVPATGWPAGSVASAVGWPAGSVAASALSLEAIAEHLPFRSVNRLQGRHSWNDAQQNLQKNHDPDQSE